MLKALFRKQMLELNQSFFYNRKNGKARSKAGALVSILLFALLMLGVIGGIFLYMADRMSPLIGLGMSWLYFLIFSGVALALGIFGSVFNTFSSLYQAKDNDLILSLPVPVRDILTVRLMGVYLMGAMYSLIVFIPAMIVYYIEADISAGNVICSVIFAFLITVFVLVLSCVLGWGVAKISGKLKNKSIITVILSLAFMGVYYFVYFRANEMISELLTHAAETGAGIRDNAHPLYVIGRAAQGDAVSLVMVAAAVLLLFAATVYVMSRSFLAVATASGNEKKAVYKEKAVKQKSVYSAWFAKEFRRFLASPAYMLNCALGTLFLVIAAVLIVVKGGWIEHMFVVQFKMSRDFIAVLMTGGVCTIVAMNDITAPSISLEGRNLWLAQSLPVTPWQILRSKLELHFLLTGVPALLCSVCSWIVIRPGTAAGILLLVTPLIFTLFGAAFGLTVNLKNPNLNWTNETAAVKQSFSILAVMFGSWIMIGVLGIGYMQFYDRLSPAAFLAVCLTVFTILSAVLIRWLRTRGVKTFREL